MLDIRFDGKLHYKIDNVGFVKVMRDKDFTFHYRNGKDRNSLLFLERGEMRYNFINSGETAFLKKGQLLFIPKKLPYVADYLEDNTIINIFIFDMQYDTDSCSRKFEAPVQKALPSSFFKYDEFSETDVRNTLFLASKIYELLICTEKDSAAVPEKFSKIVPAIEEISRLYFENEKISHYSDLCNMSESNFRKLFKEYTGKTFIEYRNLIRIYEAKKLIDSREYTVEEAAYLTGFNNMSFFYEVYNRAFGKKQ